MLNRTGQRTGTDLPAKFNPIEMLVFRLQMTLAGGKKAPIVVFDADEKFTKAWSRNVIQSRHSLRIYKERIYVADKKMHQTHEFTTNGKLLRKFETKGKARLGKNDFNMPTDLAFATNGNMYVNSRIVCLNPGKTFKLTRGKPAKGPGEFKYPHNIVIGDQGTVYVADQGNDRIQIFTPEGQSRKEWKNAGNKRIQKFVNR